MIPRLQRLRERYPDSRLDLLTDDQLAAVKERYPRVPAHVLDFFKIVGCGSIGPSQYMVYALIDGAEIFGESSAADLDGIVLIGDDFSGNHEAYDTKHGWRFGTVGSSAQFEPHTVYRDFVDFIDRRFVEE